MFDLNAQLLLACSRPKAEAGQIGRLLRQGVDWDRVLQQAAWHCVSPLLCRSLPPQVSYMVPAAARAALQSNYEDNFRKNLFMAAGMVRLATKFREHNIPVIAYKGPVIGAYYQNLGLREFGDLDFLVLPQDVSRADELLRLDGFHLHLPQPCAQEPRSLPFARAFHYEMVYTTAASGIKIDLHWALMPGFWALSDDAAEIWNRPRTLPIGGGSVTTLSHEDSLLLLCAHGTKHLWRSLGWICDVASLLHSVPDLDWPAIEKLAEKLRIVRALGLGLLLAHDLLGTVLPSDLRRRIEEDQETLKLAAAVEKTLFDQNSKPENVLDNCAFLMRTRENAQDAIRCAIEQIFQPTMAEWQAIALPRTLFPAYYLLRPIRLLTKYVFRPHVDPA